MHTHRTPHETPLDPLHARLADLSEEYLTATIERREAIGCEFVALLAGDVVPISHR